MSINWDFQNKMGDKTWVAKINGTSLQYGFDREFIKGEKTFSKSGRTGTFVCEITEEGVYQVGGNSEDNGFRMVWVKKGELVYGVISEDRAKEMAEILNDPDMDFNTARWATYVITGTTSEAAAAKINAAKAKVVGEIEEAEIEIQQVPVVGNRTERRAHLQTAEGVGLAAAAAAAKQARKEQYESAAQREQERLEQYQLDEEAQDRTAIEAALQADQWRQTPHTHDFVQTGTEAGNPMKAGYQFLMRVYYQCSLCRLEKIATQSSSTAEWYEKTEAIGYDWTEKL